jgi:diaminopimelate decarboxylase
VRYLRVSRRVKMAGLLQRLGRLERSVPDLEVFGRTIAQGFQTACARWGISPILATEPGRSITSNCGIVVGRVQVIKGHWVFSDISINDVPDNMFFTEWRKFYPNKMSAPKTQEIHLSGPTLATHDVVQFNTMAPPLEPGDLIAIFDTGAYSISRSNQFTRARSGVYFVTAHGAVETIRRPETVDDVMRMQVWPTGEGNGNGRRAGEPAAVREQRA